MIIVIDGYNLLKTMTEDHGNSERQKREMVQELKKYAAKKHHVIYAVFDGGPTKHPSYDKEDDFVVVHAGYRETADDYIKHFLQNNKHKEVLLVSSDNELVDYAYDLKLNAIDSSIFVWIFRQRNNEEPEVMVKGDRFYKTAADDHFVEELDVIMERESRTIPLKSDGDATQHRGRSPKTLKKHEKRLLKILKKL